MPVLIEYTNGGSSMPINGSVVVNVCAAEDISKGDVIWFYTLDDSDPPPVVPPPVVPPPVVPGNPWLPNIDPPGGAPDPDAEDPIDEIPYLLGHAYRLLDNKVFDIPVNFSFGYALEDISISDEGQVVVFLENISL